MVKECIISRQEYSKGRNGRWKGFVDYRISASFIPNGQLFKFNVGAVRRWLHCPGVQRIALIRLLEAKAAHALADEAFASRGTF